MPHAEQRLDQVLSRIEHESRECEGHTKANHDTTEHDDPEPVCDRDQHSTLTSKNRPFQPRSKRNERGERFENLRASLRTPPSLPSWSVPTSK